MGLFVRGHTQSVFKRKLNIAQLKFIKSLSQAIIKYGPFFFRTRIDKKFQILPTQSCFSVPHLLIKIFPLEILLATFVCQFSALNSGFHFSTPFIKHRLI